MDIWIASVCLLLCIFLYNPSYLFLILFLLYNCLGKMTRSQGRCVLRNFCTVFSKWTQHFMLPLEVSEGSKKFQQWLKNLCNFRLSDPFTVVRGGVSHFSSPTTSPNSATCSASHRQFWTQILSYLQLIVYLYERKTVLIFCSCVLIRMPKKKKKKECQLRGNILSSSESTSQKIKLTSLSTILPFGSPSILLCYQHISLQVPRVSLLSL